MNRSIICSVGCLAIVAGVAVPAIAQPPAPSPGKEHQWLQQFVGEWVTESKGSFGPDQPPVECSGTLQSRMIGGYWVVNEMKGVVMGAEMNGLQTIGFDPQSKKYVGTWIDSMSNYMWRYEGSVDASGKTLTLQAEGPNFLAAGETATFQDIYTFRSADEIAIASKMLDEDGQWVTFMSGTARRRK